MSTSPATLPEPGAAPPEARPARCENCASPLTGPYCAQCGQHAEDRLVSVRQLLSQFANHLLGLDTRFTRTVVPLLRRPGFLTNEYLAGRRVRYVPPLRLYLIASFTLFFTLAALDNDFSSDAARTSETPSDSTAAAIVTAPEDSAAAAVAGLAREFTRGMRDARSPSADPAAQTPGLEDEIEQRMGRAMERPDAFQQALLDRMPIVMFFLLPLFALLLKLLYARSGRLYVEHFIFALHSHAFAYLSILVMELVGKAAGGAVEKESGTLALLVMLVYLFLALRRVYGQSRRKTVLKEGMLLGIYLLFLGGGFVVMLLFTLWFS